MTETMKTTTIEACTNEECWVLLGKMQQPVWYGAYLFMNEGQPCRVAFDPDWVIRREEKYGDVVGWLHTHPNMIASPSPRDHRTTGGWVNCLGKPLACCILGKDGLKTWWYTDDEHMPIRGKKTKFLDPYVVGILPKEIRDHGQLQVSSRGDVSGEGPRCQAEPA